MNNKEYKHQWYLKNKERLSKKYKEYYLNNKEKIRIQVLNRKWNIDFLNLLSAQNGLCAICESPLILGRTTHVDHNHKTNFIRGILCSNCNLGLGRFKDSIVNLENAILYLKDREN